MKHLLKQVGIVLAMQIVFVVMVVADVNISASDITFKKVGGKVVDEKMAISYIVESPSLANIDISFITTPAEFVDGSFTSITVQVNGVELSDKITFNRHGSQLVHTSGASIALNGGDNELIFISDACLYPKISSLKEYNSEVDDDIADVLIYNYDNMGEIYAQQQSSIISQANSESDPEIGYFSFTARPGFSIKQPYYCTFSCEVEIDESEYNGRLTTYTYEAITPGATSTLGYTLYVFNSEDPSLYSVSAQSTASGNLSFLDYLPTGVYTIMIEAQNPGAIGATDLWVQGSVVQRNAVISNTKFDVINTYGDSDDLYNLFTANLKSAYTYYDAKPSIYLKKEVDGADIVVACSDSIFIESEFSWGNNARILTKMDSEGVYSVLLTSQECMTLTPDTCDFYYANRTMVTDTAFYQLKEDIILEDIMDSGTGRSYANCISFTIGYFDDWVFPDSSVDNNIEWFDKLYNNETVLAQFGYFKRTTGSIKYTRSEFSETDNVIDLICYGGGASIDHGQIKHTSDGAPHGYDWESVMGMQGPQFYHPRNAFYEKDSIYMTYHYNHADTTFEVPPIAWSISESTEQYLDEISLTSEEEILLSNALNIVSSSNQSEFETLYSNWGSAGINALFMGFYNGTYETPEYTALVELIESLPQGYKLLFDKYLDGDDSAALLMKNLFEQSTSQYYELWNEIIFAPIEDGEIRTASYNITNFIKEALQESDMLIPSTDGSLEAVEAMEVSVTTGSSTINIECNVSVAAEYSINIIKLGTNNIEVIQPIQEVVSGVYTHSYSVSSGIYIVNYIIDGVSYSEKVIVN